MKTCKHCGEQKPATSEFFRAVKGRHNNGKVYLSGSCICCSNERAKNRMQSLLQHPEYRIKFNLRRQLQKAATNDAVAETMRLALKRGHKSPFVERELGYSISRLRQHLERQFVNGMTWEAYMRGEIHIDHIKPKASFDLSMHSEWIECWSLSNLRPLWARDNMAKSDSITHLI